MDSFGDRLRLLAQAPLVGASFQALLNQHERNMFPAPEIGDLSASDAAASLAAEKERRQRDLTRRGANRATMDSDEESYFNDDSDDDNAALHGQQAVSPAHDTGGGFILEPPGAVGVADASSGLSQLPSSAPMSRSLVAYADDDDADADADTDAQEVAKKLTAVAEAPVSLGKKNEPTLKRRKSPIQKTTENTEGQQPRQKRRRSGADAGSALSVSSTGQFDDAEEDEDIIGRLAKRQALKNKEKEEEDEESGFLRERSATPTIPPNTTTGSQTSSMAPEPGKSGSVTASPAPSPGFKKISLGLSTSSKRMVAAASDNASASKQEEKPK